MTGRNSAAPRQPSTYTPRRLHTSPSQPATIFPTNATTYVPIM
ncbi:hypothetical protein AWB83_07031 [Caballeronia ptereochthonis]|uniref:Uncharacterized protein n=1 Tax=Caballeronia ptereochthonis TaxID=1777144 RepID=A0A158EDM1_9BURK|nr:hypothetical protein AWB83_07031 [Caballeronia ptereochthonis]